MTHCRRKPLAEQAACTSAFTSRAALPAPSARRAQHGQRPAAEGDCGRLRQPWGGARARRWGPSALAAPHGKRAHDAGARAPAAAQVAAPPREGEPAESPFTAGVRAFPPASFTTVVDTFGLCSHADPVATLRARPVCVHVSTRCGCGLGGVPCCSLLCGGERCVRDAKPSGAQSPVRAEQPERSAAGRASPTRRRGSPNRCVRWGRRRAAAAHRIVACAGAPRQEMAAVCKPGGRLLLLEHGRASAGWLNQRLDDGAERHHAKFGCHGNRPILDIVAEVRGQAGAHPGYACVPGVAGMRTGLTTLLRGCTRSSTSAPKTPATCTAGRAGGGERQPLALWHDLPHRRAAGPRRAGAAGLSASRRARRRDSESRGAAGAAVQRDMQAPCTRALAARHGAL